MAVLTSYISGGWDGTQGYDIEILFTGSLWTEELQTSFIKAADLFSRMITSDLTDQVVDVLELGVVTTEVDDLLIHASLNNLDGPGGILGGANYLTQRPEGDPDAGLPSQGLIALDLADVQPGGLISSQERLDDVVLHEMFHVLGYSSDLWMEQGLMTGAGTDDPRFTGQNAMFEYKALYPDQYAADPNAANGVPLENDGPRGTRDTHWEEDVFGSELMTGFYNPPSELSNLSIASLADIGYAINYVPTCFTPGTSIRTQKGLTFVEDLRPGDLVATKDNGFQPLLYITDSVAKYGWLLANPKLRPIHLKVPNGQGGLFDLTLSRLHKVLLTGKRVQQAFGYDEVLVPVKDFLGVDGTDMVTPFGDQRYINLLFARHQVICANGLWCESLHLARGAQLALSADDHAAIAQLSEAGVFDIQDHKASLARPIMRGKPVQHVLSRSNLRYKEHEPA